MSCGDKGAPPEEVREAELPSGSTGADPPPPTISQWVSVAPGSGVHPWLRVVEARSRTHMDEVVGIGVLLGDKVV